MVGSAQPAPRRRPDIAWHAFDGALVDPDLLCLVKAAALVERNGAAYGAYLDRLFADDPEMRADVTAWAADEVWHGAALGRWAALADPGFDAAAAFARFRAGYRLPLDAGQPQRGSRAGELVARCMVETGTASFYAAIADASREPVLRQLGAAIAADEVRHYAMFRRHLRRYPLGRLARLGIALGRALELEDDELAYAHYAASAAAAPYDRKACAAAQLGRTYWLYRPHHVARATAMICTLLGLAPRGRLARCAAWVLHRLLARRARRLCPAAVTPPAGGGTRPARRDRGHA